MKPIELATKNKPKTDQNSQIKKKTVKKID